MSTKIRRTSWLASRRPRLSRGADCWSTALTWCSSNEQKPSTTGCNVFLSAVESSVDKMQDREGQKGTRGETLNGIVHNQ